MAQPPRRPEPPPQSDQPKAPAGPNPQPVYQPAFTAGQLDPKLWFRSDLAKWHVGLALCQNFFVHVQGGVSNRPGTEYIGQCKTNDTSIRLIPFRFNLTQTYMLEVGNEYIRFISSGAYLTNADGSAYEVATPYQIADVQALRWAQSNDVLTITHPNYPPYDLNRLGELEWTFVAETFGQSIAAPSPAEGSGGLNGEAGNTGTTPPLQTQVYQYQVTAVALSDGAESLPSATINITNYNIAYFNQYNNYNVINWTAVAGANFYKVYRYFGGVFAFIGSTTSLTFNDQNITPDETTGQPEFTNPFANNNNPGAVSYFQQRKVYAGSTQYPQTMWLSKSGAYNNFDVSNPVQDSDAISATIVSNQSNIIHHVVSLSDLIVMTSSGSWKVSAGSNASAISPSAFVATPQVFSGVYANTQPLVIEYDILYVEAMGSKVRALNYNFYAQIYTTTDVSAYAESLFYGYTLSTWCSARAPFDLVWAIRSDGTLLGMTYLKEQEVMAWHQHTTNGRFLSVATVPEATFNVEEDAVYFTVQREVNGQLLTFVERMHSRLLGEGNGNFAEAWFLDCALQYRGPEAGSVSGLDYLDGMTVYAVANGYPYGPFTVENGSIDLGGPTGAIITVGLAYTSTIQTLPLDAGQPSVMGKLKRVNRVYALLNNTMGGEVSLDGNTFSPLEGKWQVASTSESTGLTSGMRMALIPPNWDNFGQITLQQTLPLPTTVLGFVEDVIVGST